MSKAKNRKRRGRGEGSVFEREDGLWVGSISLGLGENGKRKRKTVYGATKNEVLNKLDRFRGDVRTGSIADAGGLTVGQLLDRWLESSRASTETRTFEERQRWSRTISVQGWAGLNWQQSTPCTSRASTRTWAGTA